MKKFLSFIIVFASLSLFSKDVVKGKLTKEVLATGSKRVFIMSPKGEIIWQHKGKNVSDCWMLPNGNVLFGDACIKEVTRSGELVWEYKPENRHDGAFGCQRLPKGVTLVSENSTGKILEIDKNGKKIFELQIPVKSKNKHQRLRMARKLPNGNYLVCQSGDQIVREFTPKGEIVWEKKAKGLAFAAVRLKNGNTLISSLKQITEYDKKGNEVWEFKSSDLPELGITNMTGIQVLPNGNIVTGCYAAYKKGKGAGMFEITRKKKLVWSYQNPKGDRSHMGVQVLYKSKRPPLR